MKYQCNTCGRIYDEKEYAAICHPNITELEDLTDFICYNGNHESKDGVCVVDGGIKPQQ